MEKTQIASEVLAERIAGMQATLAAEFEVLHTNINFIKGQVKQTNGSVARAVNQINEIEKVQALCPREDYKKFKSELDVLRFYSRNPGLLKFTLIGIFIINVVVGGLVLYAKFT